MKENKIEVFLKAEVEKLGGLCIKFLATYFTGIPDRLVLLPGGRMYFVELKAPGKKPARRQPYVITLLQKLGFNVLVIDTIDKVNAFILWVK